MDALQPTKYAALLLKCVPLAVLVLFGAAQTTPNNYPAVLNGPYWTLLGITQTVLLVISAALANIKASLVLGNTESAEYISTSAFLEGATDLAMALSLVLLVRLLWLRSRRCLPPSAFAAALLGLLCTACALDAFMLSAMTAQVEEITLSVAQLQNTAVIVTLLVAATVAGNFVLSELQDLVIKKRTSTATPVDEDTSSVLSRQACAVLIPLFKDTMSAGASAAAEIPVLRRGLHCKKLVTTLIARLSASGRRSRTAFMIALFRVLWVDFLRIVLCTVGYYACLFAKIPALELLLNSAKKSEMTTAVLLFSATTTFEFLITCYQMDLMVIFGCRARSMLQGLLFTKVTTMSAKSKALYSAGHVASLLSVDCFLVCSFCFLFPLPFFGALGLPFIYWMLAARAGAGPALCCAAWNLVVLVLPFLSSLLQQRFWVNAVRARDERLKAITDLLSTIRVVKMYSWEDALQKNVLRYRAVELKWLLRVNMLDSVMDCVYSSTSSVVMIIMFSTLSLLEPGVVLTPVLSFSCVSLLYMTDLPMSTIASALRSFSQASLALRRIADFCTAGDQHERENDSKTLDPTTKGAVIIKNGYFSWAQSSKGNSEIQLADINLEVQPNSLIGIVGFVGSGKSSLLAAILGDMELIGGQVDISGTVAFAPQLPIVHNMTIRDNILYGKPMEPAFYDLVIRSCQLVDDINQLKSGDMTEVGEKGTNLSGGQKQRISIARAVYSRSDVYLVDDPLSALDPVVGSRVFREVFGKQGLLRNKTRIMVCNQGRFLPQMDKLVLVNDKRIRVYDKLANLIMDPESPKNFREALEQQNSDVHKTGGGSEELEENDTIGRITEEEEGKSTMTGCQLFCSLLRLAQWPACVAVLAFSAAACAFTFGQLWIKRWTDATTAGADGSFSEQSPPWVQVLVALSVLDVGLRIVGSVLLSVSAKCLSGSLHDKMLSHVLHSPVSFFDASPRGRIVNRFSSDMDSIDTRSFLSGKQSVQNTLVTIAKVAVVGTQSPVVVGITALVALLAGYGMNVAVKASHSARYYESLATSKVLQHATETLDALSSVRTYGVAERFRQHFCSLTDKEVRGFQCYGTVYRFTRMLSCASGFVVVMSTLLANTVFSGPEGTDPSSLGLALSSASAIPLSLMSLGVTLFTVLQMIVSLERCIEYAELPPESDVPAPKSEKNTSAKPLSRWPSEGKIEFQNFSASYRPGVLPNVLNNITFVVKPMEKVGVVGRTGAGKSSLVLALLRMLRASEGRIVIDGIDIAQVPLHKLRSSITVIPQDPSLVRGTLRMNLDPTNSHSDEEIWQALEQSYLTKMVSSDAKGLLLETTDGGGNLSVGQRQLVCLVRALLRGTRILLLDEATSQMDGDTDRLIQTALRSAFAQCTLFTIAHRIHTVLDYDRILVMEDGKVREFDTVRNLLSDTSSLFYSMAIEAGINRKRDELESAVTAL